MAPTDNQIFHMRSGVNAFLERYRELLASFDMQQIAEALTAYSSLGNGQLPDELSIVAYRKFTESAFLSLCDRGALTPITQLTKLGENDLAQMRISSGVGYETLPPPPSRQPTAQELLEGEVIADYNGGLSAAKMREKRNSNRAYDETFIRLAEGNQLESRVTSNVQAGA